MRRYYLFTQRHSFKAKNQDKMMLSTAEKKIILVFISFLIFGVYTMVHVAIVTAYSDEVIEGLLTYFKCELSGHVPNKCDRSSFERYSRPYVSECGFIYIVRSNPSQYSELCFQHKTSKRITVSMLHESTKEAKI